MDKRKALRRRVIGECSPCTSFIIKEIFLAVSSNDNSLVLSYKATTELSSNLKFTECKLISMKGVCAMSQNASVTSGYDLHASYTIRLPFP